MNDGFIYVGQHWRGLFHRIEFYYNPVRVESWALLNRGKIQYFTELQTMLNYAVTAKLIQPEALSNIRLNLAQTAADIDRESFSDRWENPEKSLHFSRTTR